MAKTIPFQLKTPYFIEHYNGFDKMIMVKNYGRGKIIMYQACVKEFLWYLESQGFTDFTKVKALQIVAYYEYINTRPNLRRQGTLSESMIRNNLYSVRIFFDYLIDINAIENSPARLPKFQFGKQSDRNICTTSEINLLFNTCKDAREQTILAIAYGCGLRRTEIVALNIQDILISKGLLVVRDGKNYKSRVVPISEFILEKIKPYLKEERSLYLRRNSVYTEALILNDMGSRMCGDIIYKTILRIVKRTNNDELIAKNITLHCLRHSIATHLLENGAGAEFVKSFLGHTEIDTVQLYAKRRKQNYKFS
jgi:site-specific recombinase XerD